LTSTAVSILALGACLDAQVVLRERSTHWRYGIAVNERGGGRQGCAVVVCHPLCGIWKPVEHYGAAFDSRPCAVTGRRKGRSWCSRLWEWLFHDWKRSELTWMRSFVAA
jgi:hypothetical protein